MNVCTPGNCICDAREWPGDTDCFGDTDDSIEGDAQMGISPLVGRHADQNTDPSAASVKQVDFVRSLLAEREVAPRLRRDAKQRLARG